MDKSVLTKHVLTFNYKPFALNNQEDAPIMMENAKNSHNVINYKDRVDHNVVRCLINAHISRVQHAPTS